MNWQSALILTAGSGAKEQGPGPADACVGDLGTGLQSKGSLICKSVIQARHSKSMFYC